MVEVVACRKAQKFSLMAGRTLHSGAQRSLHSLLSVVGYEEVIPALHRRKEELKIWLSLLTKPPSLCLDACSPTQSSSKPVKVFFSKSSCFSQPGQILLTYYLYFPSGAFLQLINLFILGSNLLMSYCFFSMELHDIVL